VKSCNHATAVEDRKQLKLGVCDILREARHNEKMEGRNDARHPFFRPVSIRDGDIRLSGFSRDVSETGIGLLHNFELTLGEVEVRVPTDQGVSVHVRTRITWCTPIGEGWYISGGEFVAITSVVA
jgi:hypothetical protein